MFFFFNWGQELVVYTVRTQVFGGVSGGQANVLPAPFGSGGNLGWRRKKKALQTSEFLCGEFIFEQQRISSTDLIRCFVSSHARLLTG